MRGRQSEIPGRPRRITWPVSMEERITKYLVVKQIADWRKGMKILIKAPIFDISASQTALVAT